MLPVVEPSPEHGEILAEKLRQRDGPRLPQRMLLPDHHQHLLAQELGPLEGRRQIAGDEDGEIQAAVHHAAEQLPGPRLLYPDLQTGIAVLEGHQDRGKIVGSHHVGDADAHLPPLQSLELGHLGLCLMHLAQQPLGVAAKQLPLRREAHAAVLPVEQAQIELLFQLGDGHADGWLGNVQRLCRPGEGAGIAHRQQITKLFQIHINFIYRSNNLNILYL